MDNVRWQEENRISKVNTTLVLIIVSAIVLGLEYDVFSFKGTNINLTIITFNDVKINSPHVIEALAFVFLIIIIAIRVKYTLTELRKEYSKGYQNKLLADYVKNHIAKIVGHSAHGAPYSDLNTGLFKKAIRPGRFTMRNGHLTEELTINIPNHIHLKSMLNGLWAVVFSKNMYVDVLPIILGIWSIIVIVI